MAKTSKEIEQEFIDGLKADTGSPLNAWMSKIEKSGIGKRNDIIKWLKEKQGFGHMYANLLVGIYLNDGKPVYASEANLLDNQFEKYPEMRPLYNNLIESILKWDKSSEIIPKKTYVSIAKKREFAAINIKKGELRIGLDLGNAPFKGALEKSKLTGPMPRISHMIVVNNKKQLNKDLFSLLESSRQRIS